VQTTTREVTVTPPATIAVLAHPLRPHTFPIASEIAAQFAQHGLQTHVFTDWDIEDVRGPLAASDLAVAIGGDGAMLRAARAAAPFRVPVLGVNMGQLGFLTEISAPDQIGEALERLLAGDYWLEERMMISMQVISDGQVVASADALNDVVVSGSGVGKMLTVSLYIDGGWTTTYHADGLIIATATGSTAYALAAGGPILPPELKNILILPALPHLSMERAIVLSEGSVVEVRPIQKAPAINTVWVDGFNAATLYGEERITIQAGEHTGRFARLRDRNYFYRSLLDRLEPRISRLEGDER
jgi:NAD+ kinase